MDEAHGLLQTVETLGFPIFIAVVLIGGIYWSAKWMMNTLMSKIDSNQKMMVGLIDRIRALDNSIVRMETMIRIMRDIDPDWERIGKQNPEERRKDCVSNKPVLSRNVNPIKWPRTALGDSEPCRVEDPALEAPKFIGKVVVEV